MKQLFSACLVSWIGAAIASAGPVEDAIMATMRLSDQPNYSWTSTIADDARTYDIEGKTVRGAYTRVRMPMINSVRRKLGRSVTDTHVEAVFHGNVDCVIQTEAGWKRIDELPEPPEDDEEFDRIVSRGGPLVMSGSIAGGMTAVPNTRRTRAARANEARRQAYSNLQLAISHPHEELGVIVSSHATFEVHGDVVTGRLSEVGAALLLVHDGQKEITPVQAAGTFKLWLRDGMISRYQLRLEGTLAVETPRGQTHIAVQQSSTTHVKDVGTTAFELPDEARLKLPR